MVVTMVSIVMIAPKSVQVVQNVTTEVIVLAYVQLDSEAVNVILSAQKIVSPINVRQQMVLVTRVNAKLVIGLLNAIKHVAMATLNVQITNAILMPQERAKIQSAIMVDMVKDVLTSAIMA